MTARNERAVRAGPGAASDRRGTVGEPPGLLPDPDNLLASLRARVRDGKNDRQTSGREASTSQKDEVERLQSSTFGGYLREPHTMAATAQTRGRTEGSDPSGAKAPARPRLELQPTISNPYSVLIELEHPGTFEIVMLLDREGRTNPYRMRQRLRPGQKALNRALRSLVKARLIRAIRSDCFPFSIAYELTQRGRELAVTMRSWPLILVE